LQVVVIILFGSGSKNKNKQKQPTTVISSGLKCTGCATSDYSIAHRRVKPHGVQLPICCCHEPKLPITCVQVKTVVNNKKKTRRNAGCCRFSVERETQNQPSSLQPFSISQRSTCIN
jgi:hypothetical protein